ncbi:DUF6881 domain-containing protein [Nocardia sp. NPDC049149]|uniref:DUF6881 domain-containing protein n=1 Tax=Nocardia sp. NPDC049149 TaxID=3364315 RepID=UPI0037226B64
MSSEADNRGVLGLLRQQMLIQRISGEMSTQAPLKRTEIRATYMAVGHTVELELEIDTVDGPYSGIPNIFPSEAIGELRDIMYSQGRGTWSTMNIDVVADGGVSTSFDYDSRPASETPFGFALEDDLQMYPRDSVPRWILDDLNETHRRHGYRDGQSVPGPAAPSGSDVKRDNRVVDVENGLTVSRDKAAEMAVDFVPEESGMRYMKVMRTNASDDDPAIVFSEIDDDGYESRKVEIFVSGRSDFASVSMEGEPTWLATAPLPSADEVSLQPGCKGEDISAVEFQAEWFAAGAPPHGEVFM